MSIPAPSDPAPSDPAPSDGSTLPEPSVILDGLRQKQYGELAAWLEQILSDHPNEAIACAWLGLVRLLQGQEDEAQWLWLMPVVDASPEVVDQWTAQLGQILDTAARSDELNENPMAAWTIRAALRAIAPGHLSNELRWLQVSLRLDRLPLEEFDAVELANRLTDGGMRMDDRPVVQAVLQQLLDRFPDHTPLADLVRAGLPYVDDRAVWSTRLIKKASDLARFFRRNDLACRYGEMSLMLNPQNTEALLRLSVFYQDAGRHEEGIALARQYAGGCQTALQRMMGNVVLLRSLMSAGAYWQEAEAVQEQGRQLVRELIETHPINPDEFLDPSILSGPVFFYPYFRDRPRMDRPLQNQLMALGQRAVDAYLNKSIPDYVPYPKAMLNRATDGRRLRIGYISRYLYRHSIGWLSRWLLHHHDRDRFDIYVYFNHNFRVDDFMQQWFARHATVARAVEGDALGLAKLIRDDEIDILVELDSLTADYTLGILALKPAPIQVTWLGLDASGLPTIDYFIADDYVLPSDAQSYYTERIWRIPQTYIAVDGFEVGVPDLTREQLGIPAEATVYLSAQSSAKRHPDTIRMQMRILQQVPNSYFLLKGTGDQEKLQAVFTQIAAAEGVAADRLRFLQRERYEETHRANLAIADVVLDTFPYNGATTTLETLWMGIPLVTRVGEQFAARNSYGMMMNAGITEGIAWTDEEYIGWGIRLGQERELRDRVRWALRQSRHTAPLWNGQQFARRMEAAYEEMWHIYLNS